MFCHEGFYISTIVLHMSARLRCSIPGPEASASDTHGCSLTCQIQMAKGDKWKSVYFGSMWLIYALIQLSSLNPWDHDGEWIIRNRSKVCIMSEESSYWPASMAPRALPIRSFWRRVRRISQDSAQIPAEMEWWCSRTQKCSKGWLNPTRYKHIKRCFSK